MLAPATDQTEKATRAGRSSKPKKPDATDVAYAAIVEWVQDGKTLLTQEEMAKALGTKRLHIRMALERWEGEQNLLIKGKLSEDAALAKAEAGFSEKSKLALADAIRIHKARLDKTFEQRVGEEVRRRIAAADDSVRERLKAADKTILAFERERGKRGVFTKEEFSQMLMLCHPDDPASPATRAALLQVLLKNKTSLVNPEKK
jgi:hypothetical protein